MPRAVLFVAALMVTSVVVLSVAGRSAADEAALPRAFADTMVDCGKLDIQDEDGETNTVLDLEHHLLMLDLPSSDEPITVDYADPACTEHPVIGPLVREVLNEEREDMASECQSLQEQLARGQVEARGFVLDPEKVQAHVDRWCTENAIP